MLKQTVTVGPFGFSFTTLPQAIDPANVHYSQEIVKPLQGISVPKTPSSLARLKEAQQSNYTGAENLTGPVEGPDIKNRSLPSKEATESSEGAFSVYNLKNFAGNGLTQNQQKKDFNVKYTLQAESKKDFTAKYRMQDKINKNIKVNGNVNSNTKFINKFQPVLKGNSFDSSANQIPKPDYEKESFVSKSKYLSGFANLGNENWDSLESVSIGLGNLSQVLGDLFNGYKPVDNSNITSSSFKGWNGEQTTLVSESNYDQLRKSKVVSYASRVQTDRYFDTSNETGWGEFFNGFTSGSFWKDVGAEALDGAMELGAAFVKSLVPVLKIPSADSKASIESFVVGKDLTDKSSIKDYKGNKSLIDKDSTEGFAGNKGLADKNTAQQLNVETKLDFTLGNDNLNKSVSEGSSEKTKTETQLAILGSDSKGDKLAEPILNDYKSSEGKEIAGPTSSKFTDFWRLETLGNLIIQVRKAKDTGEKDESGKAKQTKESVDAIVGRTGGLATAAMDLTLKSIFKDFNFRNEKGKTSSSTIDNTAAFFEMISSQDPLLSQHQFLMQIETGEGLLDPVLFSKGYANYRILGITIPGYKRPTQDTFYGNSLYSALTALQATHEHVAEFTIYIDRHFKALSSLITVTGTTILNKDTACYNLSTVSESAKWNANLGTVKLYVLNGRDLNKSLFFENLEWQLNETTAAKFLKDLDGTSADSDGNNSDGSNNDTTNIVHRYNQLPVFTFHNFRFINTDYDFKFSSNSGEPFQIKATVTWTDMQIDMRDATDLYYVEATAKSGDTETANKDAQQNAQTDQTQTLSPVTKGSTNTGVGATATLGDTTNAEKEKKSLQEETNQRLSNTENAEKDEKLEAILQKTKNTEPSKLLVAALDTINAKVGEALATTGNKAVQLAKGALSKSQSSTSDSAESSNQTS